MKKLYASIAAVAVAAMVTASAAIPEIVNYEGKTQALGMNPKITVPSQKALNTFVSLASVENYNGIQKVKNNVTAEDVLGSYVNLSTSLFNNNEEAVESGNISLKELNGELIVNMLLNFRTFTSTSGAAGSCPKGGPVATVEGNTLKIAFGQNIGTYTPAGGTAQPVFFVGYVFDYDAGNFTELITEGEVTFTIDANGNMTADKPYAMYINNVGWWTGVETSKFVIPNGTFTAAMSGAEADTNDIYVEKQEKNGFPVLFVSSTFFGDGYGVWFDLEEDEDGNLTDYAVAIDQIVMDASSDETEDFYLSSAEYVTTSSGSQAVRQSKTVEATLSNNNQTLTYDNTWSVIALYKTGSSLRWYGLIEPATLNFTLPGAGVEDNIIAADNSNAPVEYYNLQGIRINEPAAGSVVIRRQGTEVSKILVK